MPDESKRADALARLMEASSHGKWRAGEADTLMAAFGDTFNLFSSGRFALERANLTEAQIALIMSVSAAARRCAVERLGVRPCLGEENTRAALARAIFIGARGERFALVRMDRQLRLIDWQILSEGTLGEIVLQGEKLYESVALSDAACVMFCHNHPGGSAAFSGADVKSTKAFSDELRRLGVPMYDHLLVAGREVVSMRLSGLIPEAFSDPAPKTRRGGGPAAAPQ